LVEVMVAMSVVALLIAILLPTLKGARSAARRTLCTANLQQFGRAHGSYAADYRDLIGALNGDASYPLSEAHARGPRTHSGIIWQVKNLIERLDTRRPGALSGWVALSSLGPSAAEQFEHLALIGYASSDVRMPIAVCPEDRARMEWRSKPFDHASWSNQPTKLENRWTIDWLPYGSSYQLTPAAAAYSFHTNHNQWGAYEQGPVHDWYAMPEKFVRFGRRKIPEVAFPSLKVAVMDSQQRHFGREAFYAYPESRQPLLFWDGSVSVRATRDANKGWIPMLRPRESPDPSNFKYVPDLGFESAARPGSAYVNGHYRWTRAGLHGIDFGGGEVQGVQGESHAVHDD
jgi:hypothetical protein